MWEGRLCFAAGRNTCWSSLHTILMFGKWAQISLKVCSDITLVSCHPWSGLTHWWYHFHCLSSVHRPSKSKQTKDPLQTSVCVTRRKEMQKAEDPQKHAFKQNYFQLSHRATVSQYSLQVTTTWPSQQTMSAGSGDKDQFRACNCDLRSILSLNKPSRLYFTINWRVWRKKNKNVLWDFF